MQPLTFHFLMTSSNFSSSSSSSNSSPIMASVLFFPRGFLIFTSIILLLLTEVTSSSCTTRSSGSSPASFSSFYSFSLVLLSYRSAHLCFMSSFRALFSTSSCVSSNSTSCCNSPSAFCLCCLHCIAAPSFILGGLLGPQTVRVSGTVGTA